MVILMRIPLQLRQVVAAATLLSGTVAAIAAPEPFGAIGSYDAGRAPSDHLLHACTST